MIEYGLSLGSNLGRRRHNLRMARRRLAEFADVLAVSPLYETEPVDVPEAHRKRRFLNAVIIVASALSPEHLLRRLRRIERELGRGARRPKNAPRTIDLDILYAGRLRRRAPRLTIPHPLWSQRRFVLRPLADVRPNLRIPGDRRTVREVLLSLPKTPKVILCTRIW